MSEPAALGRIQDKLTRDRRRTLVAFAFAVIVFVVGAIIAVRTSGMWMLVMATPSSATSGPTHRLSAASADFDATYAPNRGGNACVPMLEMLMMCPRWRSRMPGSTARISLTAPK